MKTCRRCKVELTEENWYSSQRKMDNRQCIDCLKKTANKYNDTRLYIDGVYIGKKTDLYHMLKPGRYTTTDGRGLDGLVREEDASTEGYVYAIYNKAWPDWVKIGKATDEKQRLDQFQTSSPHRDYALLHSVFVDDRSVAEKQAHKKAQQVAKDDNFEWFMITHEQAVQILNSLLEQDEIPQDLFAYAERVA
jgi:hypothetical protein